MTVIQFPKRPVIFNERQKAHLKDSIKDLHEQPEVIVDRFESAMCADLISAVRELASVAAEKVGNKIADLIFGEKK